MELLGAYNRKINKLKALTPTVCDFITLLIMTELGNAWASFQPATCLCANLMGST